MGKYPTPPGDSVEPFVQEFRKQRRQARESARPSGTNIAELVQRVRALVSQVQAALVNINATVIAATNSYLGAGTVSMGTINASGSVNASGDVTGANLTAGGRVTSAAAFRSTGSRAYVMTVGYAGAWLDGDGTLGISPSSIRFKTDVEQWQPDIERLLLLRAVMFRYDLPGADPDAPKQIGFIAEELDALGFPEFLFYDPDGVVEGINYDRLTVALLVLAQTQETRLQNLEARLDAAGF